MRFIDFFAGIGGFRRGMELAGHTCTGFCEYDRFAVASYTSMHLITEEQRGYLAGLDLQKRQKEILKEEYRNGEWYEGDIRRIRAGTLPRAECWCFGAPCQSFSIAGKRAGLDGESGLIREIFRILREEREKHRPEWLIYENVKGMFSSNRGFDYLAILSEMDELGYDVEWQLFNSKDWGVPQNRERVYTVGHLRRCGSRKIFPFEGEDGADRVSVDKEKQELGIVLPIRVINTQGRTGKPVKPGLIVPTLRSEAHGNEPEICIPVLTPDRVDKRQNGRRFKDDGEPSFTLTSQDRHGVAIPVHIDVVCNTKPPECRRLGQREDVWGVRGVAGSLTATEYKMPHRIAIPVKEATKQGYALAHEGDAVNLAFPNSSNRRGRAGDQIANRLDTSCNQGIFVQVSEEFSVYAIWYEKYQCYIAIRKLTPKECFRLQGWQCGCEDDRYFERAQFVNSDSQLYKQAGNGVTVNVVEAIGRGLKKYG